MVQAILLDTNVLSELMRPQPDVQVFAWFELNTEAKYYTSAVDPRSAKQNRDTAGKKQTNDVASKDGPVEA